MNDPTRKGRSQLKPTNYRRPDPAPLPVLQGMYKRVIQNDGGDLLEYFFSGEYFDRLGLPRP